MTSLLMDAGRSILVIVDFQSRLLPAIDESALVVANARRLLAAAGLMAVPVVVTEQNPQGLGTTTAELEISGRSVIEKQAFGSCATPAFNAAIGNHSDIVVAGCEAHVCVLQTTLGLIEGGRRVFLVSDAIGARAAESKQTALDRAARHGADIVTTEMVVFEWLRSCEHPQFKAALRLIK
jgi:nicotinamidase-related amidase